jgi:tungstate transport system ATP-binding protein
MSYHMKSASDSEIHGVHSAGIAVAESAGRAPADQTGTDTAGTDRAGTDGAGTDQQVSRQSLLPLQVTALNYAVDNRLLLRDVHLEIATEGITLLLGHNGAGKSLLLRQLHGLLTPSSGSVYWNGQSVDDVTTRKQQAMVFQKPVVLRRSVAANVDFALSLRSIDGKALGNADRRDRRDKLLQEANLLNLSRQHALSLSGGEQQRLAIARALATDPSVLFLDEPTASMDPAATAAIEQLVQAISQRGIKVIMVTHDIAQARRLASDVVFLHRGTVTDYRSAADFFTADNSQHAQNYLTGQL